MVRRSHNQVFSLRKDFQAPAQLAGRAVKNLKACLLRTSRTTKDTSFADDTKTIVIFHLQSSLDMETLNVLIPGLVEREEPVLM